MQQTSADIELCKQTLIQSALDAGGYDNVTLALFETVDFEDAEPKVEREKGLKQFVKKLNRETKEVNDIMLFEDEESSVAEVETPEPAESGLQPVEDEQLCIPEEQPEQPEDVVMTDEESADDVDEDVTESEDELEEVNFAEDIKADRKRRGVVTILWVVAIAVILAAILYMFR